MYLGALHCSNTQKKKIWASQHFDFKKPNFGWGLQVRF